MHDLKKKFLNFLIKEKFFVLTVLFCVVFYYPVVFQGKVALPADALVGAHVPWIENKWAAYPAGVPIKNLEITDSISQFYPWRALAGEFWRNLTAPLWNPYMLNGTPFLATLHSASLYPLNFVYLLLGDIDSWNFVVMTQTLLASTFMYLFLRKLALRAEACYLGSIAFAMSGYMLAWAEFATGPHAGLWLPLLLYFVLLLKEKNLAVVVIPILFFFVFTAGDFQVPVYVCLIYFAFVLYVLRNARMILKAFAAFGAGLMLSAVQLIPTLELFAKSMRGDDPYIKDYFFGILHWEKIVNFVWPDFFGNVVTGNYWGKFGFHEYMAFVGVIALVFALFAVSTVKQKIEKFFVFLLVVALLFLFPFPTAFLPFTLKIPGLSTSSASRLLFVADFSLAALAAFGANKWLMQKKNHFSRVPIVLTLITAGVAILLILKASGYPDQSAELKIALKNMLPASMVLIAIIFLSRFRKFGIYGIILLATVEMLWYGWKNTPFTPREFVFPETSLTRFLNINLGVFRFASGIPLNLHLPFKLSSPEGYDPLYPRINSEWLSMVNFGVKENLSRRYGLIHYFDSELINFASVKYVVDYKKNHYGGLTDDGDYARGIESAKFKEVFREGRVSVFENRDVLPFVWFTEKVESRNDEVYLQPQATSETKIANLKQGLNKLEFEATVPADGYLFVAQTFYPGWRAFVDGSEKQINKANEAFQSIKIDKGNHSVVFRYVPESFAVGKRLFVLGFSAIILYWIYGRTRQKRK